MSLFVLSSLSALAFADGLLFYETDRMTVILLQNVMKGVWDEIEQHFRCECCVDNDHLTPNPAPHNLRESSLIAERVHHLPPFTEAKRAVGVLTKGKKGSSLDRLHRVMFFIPLILCLFQHPLATSSNSLQLHRPSTNLNTESSPIDLASVLRQEWNTIGSDWSECDILSIAEGTYVGNDIKITSRSLELSGKGSFIQNGPGTRIVPLFKSDRKRSEDVDNMQAVDRSMFILTNSTLSLKWMDFSLVDQSEVGRQHQIERSTRLAIVSSSMLTISESRIEMSPWNSALLISPSTFEESGTESSIVVQNSLMWNELGELRGVVDTSSYPSFEGSVSVSIVVCSFHSQALLGKDRIGLSLTRTPRQNVDDVGMISSSLIGCSFVNMSSIGSPQQPHVPHLNQKMLGCVVSLTSSHLSGSTIRDVNNGGSLLCSNSSFSSFLSSSNIDTEEEPTVTYPNGTTAPFVLYEDMYYYFTQTSGNENTSITFSHCPFDGTYIYESDRPITIYNYPGTVKILSCSFTDIYFVRQISNDLGGAVSITVEAAVCRPVTVRASNFSRIRADNYGGGMHLSTYNSATVVNCIFEECTPLYGDNCIDAGLYVQTRDPSYLLTGTNLVFKSCQTSMWTGGMHIYAKGSAILSDCLFDNCSAYGYYSPISGGLYVQLLGNTQTSISRLTFTDCWSDNYVGGMELKTSCDVILTDLHFFRCTPAKRSKRIVNGGLRTDSLNENLTVSIQDCSFIECSSANAVGAAFHMINFSSCVVSDCLVKDCTSAKSGAITLNQTNEQPWSVSLTRVAFINNSVGPNEETSESVNSGENSPCFIDVYLNFLDGHLRPTLSIADCFTTSASNSIGMLKTAYRGTPEESSDPMFDAAFNNIGPLLTEGVQLSFERLSGRMELEMKGKIPIASQKYEVTFQNNDDKTEMKTEIEFVDGKGTLTSPSPSLNLNFSTSYTVTSIVGIVPSSSSSLSNVISFPLTAWAFNLDSNPSFFSFTTPTPPTLVGAKAHLVLPDQPLAYISLMLSEEVKGSYEIVVEEEGKDVVVTVEFDESSLMGDSSHFIVVGDDRVLTHNTTYTIKSIAQSPGTGSPFVWMKETITFHIPPSVYDAKKAKMAETKKLLSWLIPLIVCVCVALIVILVILVVLKRRRSKGKNVKSEMEEQEPVELEKVEEFGVDCSNGVIRSDGMSHSAFASTEDHPSNKEATKENNKSQRDIECAEVMACSGDFAISAARMDSTLYSMIHKEHREIGKRVIGLQIVNGLKEVVAHRGWSDVLTRLSSHWILVDAEGNVRLKLEMSSSEADAEAARQQRQKEQPLPIMEENEIEIAKGDDENTKPNNQTDVSGMDGLRWRAPEVVSAEERSGVKSVDGHKASVFSLGLILWEIETGQVPFGELDAVNAQRQSGTGTPPKMESLKDEEFISLIHRCVSVNPKERPTLTEVGEFLSSHPSATRVPSGIEMKE
ncbi:hypothetical protein BLNAU_8727 [Blattamonas nauphoetae]|uniref:Protein kinase domain-containing protein n=1 Tax=Blattamonas nauphoetae TaxID=2049346 RepID=A0ABQ9XXZ5_9EUKA|nr:hypothetical protein BLNAU_8727 [Blattamonas nauphoetae]